MISPNTLKTYCCEDISLIENYDKAVADKTQIWQCHHRLETHYKNGCLRKTHISVEELKKRHLYYNRPAKELIFLTSTEHQSLHNSLSSVKEMKSEKRTGVVTSEETKRKQSEYLWYNNGIEEVKTKNRPNGFVPGRLPFSEEFCKIRSERNKKCRWYNNGKKSIFSEECPPGFVLGRLAFNNIGNKGLKWWNNGVIQIQSLECPEGFVSGRLDRKGKRWYNNGTINKLSFTCPKGFVEGLIRHKSQ